MRNSAKTTDGRDKRARKGAVLRFFMVEKEKLLCKCDCAVGY